jgi:hypothetical protein
LPLATAIVRKSTATRGRFVFRTDNHIFGELVHGRYGTLLDHAPNGDGLIDLIVSDSKISSLINVEG